MIKDVPRLTCAEMMLSTRILFLVDSEIESVVKPVLEPDTESKLESEIDSDSNEPILESESIMQNVGGIETVQLRAAVRIRVTGTQSNRRVTGDAANSEYGM